ncbi:putative tubulin-tyrosine ligase PBY1-like protein 3 [Diplogelasinospora grovesii]|uniref:Tubulin-tyrosine ligase PBY1-like protein 3 n=1 Tax=Diplogelasinospora grovesii TaxID=303347 RepID=A0AAN6N6T1_9PEZI|nr:putative tubulin-tyrosine ligase PBY1-like protein 3 [Diplogelasinospora grovesii]
MYVFVQAACPWLDEHLKLFIQRHAPDAIFINDFEDIPADATTIFQYCGGSELNRNFALHNKVKGLINAYPNSDALARKDHLAAVVDYWTAKRPDSILKQHVPQTVRLTLDYAEYVDEALTAADDLTLLASLEDNDAKDPQDREWWILKPALVDCGAGIRLFSTIDELASHLELAEYEDESEDDSSTEDESSEPQECLTDKDSFTFSPLVFKEGGRIPSAQMRAFVAQRYIASIAPLENRKWHARAYVLSIGRLKVHVFHEMLALLAGEDYKPPWENPSLQSSLTDTALQDDEVVVSRESIREFWAIREELLPGERKERIFDQICGISGEFSRTLDGCFGLFGVDFLVDDRGNVWLLEVNETPAFYQQGIAGPLSLRLMESVVQVAMEHMGVVEGGNREVKGRMVEVLDETGNLAKSNIMEILPED